MRNTSKEIRNRHNKKKEIEKSAAKEQKLLTNSEVQTVHFSGTVPEFFMLLLRSSQISQGYPTCKTALKWFPEMIYQKWFPDITKRHNILLCSICWQEATEASDFVCWECSFPPCSQFPCCGWMRDSVLSEWFSDIQHSSNFTKS